jgi:hypothetical protein
MDHLRIAPVLGALIQILLANVDATADLDRQQPDGLTLAFQGSGLVIIPATASLRLGCISYA